MAYIVESVVTKQGAISNSYRKEETGIVVEQPFMLLCRRPEAIVRRIVSNPLEEE